MTLMPARVARFLLALGLCAAAAACAGGSQGSVVTIMVPWSGPELQAFEAVVRPYAAHHGFIAQFESTTGITQQLDADLAGQGPSARLLPDLVDFPSPGQLVQYEGGGKGLMPIDKSLLAHYDQPWLGLAKSNGKAYAVPVKADVKSLIWYEKGAVRPPGTWRALWKDSKSGTPWCLGLGTGSASGWPGADWIADIMLSQPGGVSAYKKWVTGQSWTSSAVRAAWFMWTKLMRHGTAVPGGSAEALKTAFNNAMPGTAPTGHAQRGGTAEPGCVLDHGALAATGLTATGPVAPVSGYDFVPFPSAQGRATRAPLLVSGDFMGRFTGKQDARKLLTYLATDNAQDKLVAAGGFAFSARRDVRGYPLKPAYSHQLEQRIAGMLQNPVGETFCFSAEDLMKPDMTAAFEQAVLEYMDNPGSIELRTLLRQLQAIQGRVRVSPAAEKACT